MKESDEFDKLLRTKMEQYWISPSPEMKARFMVEGNKILPEQNYFGIRILWIIIILLLGIGSMTYLKLNNDKNIFNKKAQEETELNQIKQELKNPVEDNKATANNQPAKSKENEIINSFGAADDVNISNFKTPSSTVEDEYQNTITNNLEGTKQDQTFSILFPMSNLSLNIPTDGIFDKINYIDKSYQTDSIQHSENKLKNPNKPNSGKNHLRYDLYYRPEVIYNIIDSKKFINSFGAEVQYRFFNNRYLLLTGLGLSLSQGYYEYIIDYQEHLGSYNKLDSVTFSLSSDKFHLVPSYFYSEKDVFDTAITNYATKYYKQFSYLQIPLIMGYDFIQKNNYSIGLRAGPSLSLLLNNKTIEVNYDPGKNKIIQINQITPDRINANWQFVAGINTTFYKGDHLFFEVEPRFTYYFNSVYQQSNSSNPPYSIGLRIAVGIK